MDPEAALEAIRALTKSIHSAIDESPEEDIEDIDPEVLVAIAQDANELIDHIDALDEWLSHQGFLPSAWRGDR